LSFGSRIAGSADPFQRANDAVLHRREDASGFYVRARLAGSWITWQVTGEGEQWLRKSGFGDGDSIDLELLDMMHDKGWLYTGGSGPGVALESGRLSFLQVGEGVKHQEFGIGQIKEILKDGTAALASTGSTPRRDRCGRMS